ncbi:hypothetical protein M407DRAFT_24937 [Tulasnella calospora MUT 4182]|uniref:Uncharacterized protein n=1 Tax=Tulasnella calospora MUT 4182 TaxID=1051891 RepID=A0A0C3LWP6_9AGAM|nr:hypothetical protein M407DRAFT_24937 [Tulasnella calospora MUT 4182]
MPRSPELLIGVLQILYMDDTIPRKSKGDSSHKLLNLMAVCKSFNQVRTIRNTEGQEAGWIEWIGKHITKSGELPFRVFFVLSSLSPRKIYPILLPTSPRWAHLTITPLAIFNEPCNDPNVLQRLFDAPIPQFLSLSVRGLGEWVDAIFDIGTVFRHAPKLVELEWHDRFMVFRPDDGETGHAKEYVRFKSMQSGTYDLAQYTLEVLSIQGMTPPITLESMLPVLEELHTSGNPYHQERGLVSPTFPAPKKIEWFDAESDPTPADNQSNNFLLGGARGQPTDRISPFLTIDDATGAPKYCPNLQELRLQEAGFGELERLAELRPRLEKVELVALRHNSISPSPLEEDRARLERVKERVEVIFQEWVS